ncbi:MAG: hypothetical protein KF727_14490 [Microbacteriaceae bacterium]|nr:hypothetical protein [Microbacteriaceae bacterium]
MTPSAKILAVSSSPRSTWVWAADEAAAAEVRAGLEAAGRSWWPAEGRNAEARVTDLDIGVDAAESLAVLVTAGYTFRWHESQYEMDRHPTLYGVDVGGA